MKKQQIKELTSFLNDQQLSAAILTNWHSIEYFSDFASDPIERVSALLIFNDQNPVIFCPALETNAVKETGWPFEVVGYQDEENPWLMIANIIKKNISNQSKIKLALEKDNLTLKRFNELASYLEIDETFDITEFINKLRLIKSEDEIQKMFAAGKTADFALEAGFNALYEGVSELEVLANLEFESKKHGVPAMSFETLVQFGKHAAEPHGATGNTILHNGDMVLFDLGTMSKGYASDVSRTVAFNSISNQQKDVYNIVLEAQLEAQSKAKVGMTAGELDAIARKVISKYGYGEYFTHRLGHGLGASVHEFPSIMANSDLILQEGMVFSIEPGIYIPNTMGVRIEDSVVLTKDGALPFTHTSKELRIIK